MKCTECLNLIKAIDAYIAKEDDDLKDQLNEAGYADAEETVDEAEKLEEGLSEVMNHDTEVVAGELEKADSVDDFLRDTWEVYQNASALADDIHEVMENGLSSIIPKLVGEYLMSTDHELVATAIRARTTDFISSWAEDLGRIMKLNSHTGIQGILTDALASGKSVAETTRELMDSGIRSNYSRARATALTEMLTAHSAANQEAMMQSPAVEDKEWKHTGSRRNKPRPNHVDMDGQVVPKEEPFKLIGAEGGTYKPMYPRDPILPAKERVNCHCIDSPIVSASVLGLPLEERKALQQQAIDEDDRKWAEELDERNKRRSGNQTYGKPINSLLPNANRGVLKPTRKVKREPGTQAGANEVIEYKGADGAVYRYYYDADGKAIMRLDNSDHGKPEQYPYGNGGAHYNRALYDDEGKFIGWSEDRCLTAKMRRLNADIIDHTLKSEIQ